MKWLKMCFLAVLALLTILTSYPQCMLKSEMVIEDNNNVNIVDKVYKSKSDYLEINVVIPQLQGLSNKESETNINSKITKWTEDWINDVKQIADEYFKGYPSPSIPYQLYARYKITNKDDIISFYIDYYQFTGGAHGITTRIAYNVDKDAGKELKLNDIFKENFNYKEVIDKEIYRQINKDPDRYFIGKEGFSGISENEKFYIKNNSIIIYFGQYEIAPYAAGMPEFIITDKIIKGNIKYDKI